MSDLTIVPGQRPGPPEPSVYLTPIASVALPAGAPVYFVTGVDNTVALAKSDAIATSYKIGVPIGGVEMGDRATVQCSGPIDLEETQWDALTGGVGGLTRGPYYVSQTVAGQIQQAVPTGAYAVLYGYAFSSRVMMLAPSPQFPVEQE